MNHIAFCINNNWAMAVDVLIRSINYYNSNMSIEFHVLSKDLSQLSKMRLKKTAETETNKHITFYQVDDESVKKLTMRGTDHLSIETYYRFLLPTMLNDGIKNVLYLDADILCTGELGELFETDITNSPCGMALDMRCADISKYNRLNYDFSAGYFNAGVMFLNLAFWRENKIADKLINFILKNPDRCFAYDQDAINALLHTQIKRLKFTYNYQHLLFRASEWDNEKCYITKEYTDEKVEKKYWNEIIESIQDLKFVHFTGRFKPWHKECNIPFCNYWRVFFQKSEWHKEKFKSGYKSNVERIKMLKKRLLHKKIKGIYSYPPLAYEIEKKYIDKDN